MKNFNDLKQYASLTWAVYADATDKVIPKEYNKTKYKSENNGYTSGFQARVYESKNELVLSIRGTEMNNGVGEFWRDLIVADGNLALNSMPSGQVADMIDFINSIKNTLIEAKNSGKKITIVGHSLGGTLSQIASKAFPNLFDECYTFNSPSGKDLFDYKVYKDGDKYYMLRLSTPTDDMQGGKKIYLSNTVGEALYNYQNSQMTTSVTDIAAKDDPRIINNLWWKDRFGDKVEVSGDSHSIVDLTQILYFYDMAISNGASENEVTSYLSGFYNTPNSLLKGSVASIAQSTISQIEKIVNGAGGANDIIEICNAYENNNVKFNLNLISPTSSVTSFFSGSNLSTPSLYALVNLNPFIVSGVDSSAYSELEKFKDEYSGNYVSDKAKMLEALLGKSNSSAYYSDLQTGKIYHSETIVDDATTDEYIVANKGFFFGTNSNDIITGKLGENFIDTRKENFIYTLAGDDRITLTKGSNYIEAGSGNDRIDLSGITDTSSVNTIYADLKDSKDDKDSGDDTIIGSAGKDTMYGGSGYDTYKAGNGDTIEDDDKGQGEVYFNDTKLSGGYYNSDSGVYFDGTHEYKLNGNTLIITHKDSGESITINNFTNDINNPTLGIILLQEITIKDIQISDKKESSEKQTLTLTLSRDLLENETLNLGLFIKSVVGSNQHKLKQLPRDNNSNSNQVKFELVWFDDKIVGNDEAFKINASGSVSYNDTISQANSTTQSISLSCTMKPSKDKEFTIKDDDKDDDYPPQPDMPDNSNSQDFASPLVLDLNNNGITSIRLNSNLSENVNSLNGIEVNPTNPNSKIYFDLNNDNFKENTSWIEKDDGFLVIDKNNNGIIDNGNELFGNNTLLTNGNFAKDGFQALSEFDSNNDGIINNQDENFHKLKIWQDINSNATTDINELKSLDELGITSISLNAKNIDQTDINENIISHSATFTRTITQTDENNNQTTTTQEQIIDDVWFKTNPNDTIYDNKTLSFESLNLKGSGKVKNLQDEMIDNEKLRSFISTLQDKSYTSFNQIQTDAKELLYIWSKTDNIDKNKTRGEQNILSHNYDNPSIIRTYKVYAYEKDVALMEAFMGKKFTMIVDGKETDKVIGIGASNALNDYIKRFVNLTAFNILAQKLYKDELITDKEWVTTTNAIAKINTEFANLNLLVA